MLRAGMINQVSSGIYSWLPLGLIVLRNIERVIREEMNKAGAQELLMPTMQPIELWHESGRGGYGKETLRAIDRHERELIYGPTHEEVVTDIFRQKVKSYKQLPMTLYQIQWKFRDEIRPRFGVMRGREFLMKDAYSFTEDEASHITLYYSIYAAYLRIFRRLGLKAIPFVADTGLIGGNLSHEFQVIADTGESDIYYDVAFEQAVDTDTPDIEYLKTLYSAADEKHNAQQCPVPQEKLRNRRGIEVGHIFYFDDKYSKPMKAHIRNREGQEVPVKMGAHGIGVSRLMGAIIEAYHDEKGIIWPEEVTPFKYAIINLKPGDPSCDTLCEQLYRTLPSALYDDTDERAGAKFAKMELIGIPKHIIIGPKLAVEGMCEMKCRITGVLTQCSVESLLA